MDLKKEMLKNAMNLYLFLNMPKIALSQQESKLAILDL